MIKIIDDGVKVLRGLLTQYGDSLPTLYILENTIGAVPRIERAAAGDYDFKFPPEALPGMKTLVFIGAGQNTDILCQAAFLGDGWITVVTLDMTAPVPSGTDNGLNQTSLEIRVYP